MPISAVNMNKPPMHIVFRLREALPNDLEHLRATRRLTFDPTQTGLSGSHGLFGSLEWWNNIALGHLPGQNRARAGCGARPRGGRGCAAGPA